MTTTKKKTSKHSTILAELIRTKRGFAKSFDGTRLHYRTTGKGPVMICCNGLGVPDFFWRDLESFFKFRYQVVVWDYRGHGSSEIPKKAENATIDALAQDCQAVLKTLKVKKAILVGFSLGTQVIFEFYRKYPEMVSALIPCLGTYGHPMDTFYNSPFSKYLYEIMAFIGTVFPRQGNIISRFLLKNPLWYEIGGWLKMIHPGMASKEDALNYIDHILNVEPAFFTHLLKSMQEHSAENVLKKIRVPSLIIGADSDQFTPVWIAKKMHRTIPKSELFVIQRATHSALLEQPEVINLRVDKFLRERVENKKAKALSR
jgi:pimeloyl-ACP methyl ester carboxylesterase